MSPTSPLFALMIVLVALGFTNRLAAHTPPPDYKRFRTLDGLRGLAALAVVIHHSEVWYFFNSTGHWLNPPSNFYTQCGQGGVTVFFVMTGFLFWDKIKPDRPIDWVRFYTARILRLMPLFYVLVLLIMLLSAISSGFRTAFIPPGALVAIVTMFPRGVPDFFHGTNVFFYTVGVTWSLSNELFFYLLLPALFLAKSHTRSLGRSTAMLIVGVLAWRFGVFMGLNWMFLRSLFIGVLCYEICHARAFAWLRPVLVGPVGTLLIGIVLLVIVRDYNSAFYSRAELLYGAMFLIVACGNTGFGLLTHRATRKLGEISYGVYLLQGFALFTVFHHAHRTPATPLHHWVLAIPAVLGLIAVSAATFRWIERPCIDRSRAVAASITRLITVFTPHRLRQSSP
ncbi:MAG: acyltransferase [Proteobacteria bacterium]|nr:acyltransferase [Pseudomonadota bacterium]